MKQGQRRQILLQNENGPCPLLAAANALLLSGTISLPPHSIRANVATIDNVVNMLADHALKSKTSISSGSSKAEVPPRDVESEHHIHELLHLFPSLQYGMDVNPKFHAGPTGVEYTQNLSAFDLMGVELVHGWLVDPLQDGTVSEAIGKKSYNELMETIISGNEAGVEIQALEKEIEGLEKELEKEIRTKGEAQDNKTQHDKDQEWINVPPNTDDGVEEIQNGVQDLSVDNETKIQKLIRLKKEVEDKSTLFTNSMIIKSFLDETSHQLTYPGLLELHSHVQEGKLYVFFRNNHFATLTKTNGTLYLLVTDLGYANVENVLWEKLDDVSGDTEYTDHEFVRLSPGLSMGASGPNLSPEQLLAQSSGTDADFQLAVELSQNNESAMDAREGELIAAATAASLQEYNNTRSGNTSTLERQISEVDSSEIVEKESLHSEATKVLDEARDREMALQLQAQFEQERRSQEEPTTRQRSKDSGCLVC